MKTFYRVALFCGAFPLLVGGSIFLLWLITRWDWLPMAGFFTLCGGAVIFLIGVAALGRYCWLALWSQEVSRRGFWLSTLACAALLLLNFPVAAGITAGVIAIETRYTIVVHNDSHRTVEGVRVFGGGSDESLGSIPAGGSARESFWIQHDGELQFRARAGKTTHEKTVDDYVTNGMGGHTVVRIKPDGTISLRNDTM